MNILHIGKYFLPFQGGIENTMLALMKAQVNAGHKLSAIVHQHNAASSYQFKRQFNCNIYTLPILTIILFVPIALSAPFYIHHIIKKEQPDVIHCHMPNLTCFWLLVLPAARRIPWVIHWHSDVIGAHPPKGIKLLYPVYRVFEKALLKKARAIIVTSESYLLDSKPLLPFIKKSRVIPLGLPVEPLPDTTQHADGIIKLLCVGRLTYYKGHTFLLQALKQINNSRIALSIVGTGELESQLKTEVINLGIASQVEFKGQLDDSELACVLNECDILILPSIEKTEAFGLVLLEAMRAGKPCICTDVPGSGMSEVIQHNVNGLVAKHSDATSLAQCILQMSASSELRHRLGQTGRQLFEQVYSIEKVSSNINKLYSEL